MTDLRLIYSNWTFLFVPLLLSDGRQTTNSLMGIATALMDISLSDSIVPPTQLEILSRYESI